MDPTRLMTMPCTITTRTVTEGSPTEDDEVTEDSTDELCFVAQNRRDENTGADNTETQTFAGYFAPDSAIDEHAAVAVGGDTFEVVGPPWHATNPRLQRVTHIEATLTKVA